MWKAGGGPTTLLTRFAEELPPSSRKLRDLAPSDLPPPIRVSHSMTDGNSAYTGEFEGLAPYGVPHATGAKDGKKDWLLEIRAGNRANDAGWVAGRD